MIEQDQGQDAPAAPPTPTTYTREQLRDSAFFAANRADIMAAYREGRITTDRGEGR
jgi:hypothetical protein